MNVEGSIQLNVDINETEINRAIELLRSLVLSPKAPDSAPAPDDYRNVLTRRDNNAEESLALNKAADELDQKYDHSEPSYKLEKSGIFHKTTTSHVLEKLPPKVLTGKIEKFRTTFELALGSSDDISMYRVSKPLIKSGLVKDNLEARELVRIALRRGLIKETRSEVYSRP